MTSGSPHPAIAPGKVAAITGGASGIGLAAAQRFVDCGMRLMLARWRPEFAEAFARHMAG